MQIAKNISHKFHIEFSSLARKEAMKERMRIPPAPSALLLTNALGKGSRDLASTASNRTAFQLTNLAGGDARDSGNRNLEDSEEEEEEEEEQSQKGASPIAAAMNRSQKKKKKRGRRKE